MKSIRNKLYDLIKNKMKVSVNIHCKEYNVNLIGHINRSLIDEGSLIVTNSGGHVKFKICQVGQIEDEVRYSSTVILLPIIKINSII